MAVGEDVVGADGLTNRQRFDMRREQKRQEKAARAARAAAAPAASAGGMLSAQQPTPSAPAMSYDERRYQELLGRGVINEQGDILKPGGLNPTEIMRGEAPSWASPELIKNAYIQAFESKARGGQNFMDSGDYQNFLNAGYSLTQDQIDALGGVQNQGNQNDLTFGGGQPITGVAAAASSPTAPSPAPSAPGSSAAQAMLDYDFKERDAYKSGKATPFMDAYLRSREAATKEGPVSSLFKDMLEGS